MIQYTSHALSQMELRDIPKEWVELVLKEYTESEVKNGKRSFLKCFPEKGKMLRVVTRENDSKYVMAYFDRRKPCG